MVTFLVLKLQQDIKFHSSNTFSYYPWDQISINSSSTSYTDEILATILSQITAQMDMKTQQKEEK